MTQNNSLNLVNTPAGAMDWGDEISGSGEPIPFPTPAEPAVTEIPKVSSPDRMPRPVSLNEAFTNLPAPPPELIEDLLRTGHKMLISGPSKAGKSFLLMELAAALGEGNEWLGFRCRKSTVLYINLEIDSATCLHRFKNIYSNLGYKYGNLQNVLVWNLRGRAKPLDQLVPVIIQTIRDYGCEAVIIDPIYKVITGDENNASEMSAFCNEFDHIASETGCAVIYCHHHSKSAQSYRRASDRSSGSGVFARDPDCVLSVTQLDWEDSARPNITAWRMESVLREFAIIKPLDFWFRYPVHVVDESGALENCSYLPDSGSAGATAPKRSAKEKRTLLIGAIHRSRVATQSRWQIWRQRSDAQTKPSARTSKKIRTCTLSAAASSKKVAVSPTGGNGGLTPVSSPTLEVRNPPGSRGDREYILYIFPVPLPLFRLILPL